MEVVKLRNKVTFQTLLERVQSGEYGLRKPSGGQICFTRNNVDAILLHSDNTLWTVSHYALYDPEPLGELTRSEAKVFRNKAKDQAA